MLKPLENTKYRLPLLPWSKPLEALPSFRYFPDSSFFHDIVCQASAPTKISCGLSYTIILFVGCWATDKSYLVTSLKHSSALLQQTWISIFVVVLCPWCIENHSLCHISIFNDSTVWHILWKVFQSKELCVSLRRHQKVHARGRFLWVISLHIEMDTSEWSWWQVNVLYHNCM